jgi:hypothetical protein
MTTPPTSPETVLIDIIDVLRSVHSALDHALGDTDVTHIENDDELCEEFPVQWAAERLAHAIQLLEGRAPAQGVPEPSADQLAQFETGIGVLMSPKVAFSFGWRQALASISSTDREDGK